MTAARPRFGLSIRQIALVMAGALVGVLAVMAVVGVLLLGGMRAIADNWTAYDLGAASKADSLSELRAAMGLGGVVDLFHDFVMKGARASQREVERAIALARANLSTYRELSPPTADEERAIDAIARTLDRYAELLPAVAAMIKAGQPTETIFGAESIDIAPAVDGLRTLDAHLSRDRAALTATYREVIHSEEQILAVGGGVAGSLVAGLAVCLIWLTRTRILRPLARLVEDSRLLANRALDRPFVWARADELGQLGTALESSRVALRELFTAIEEKTRRLTESERRYAMAAAASNDGLWDWSLVTGEVYASPRLRQMLGLGSGELGRSFGRFMAIVHPDDAGQVRLAWRGLAAAAARDTFEVEFRARPQKGPETAAEDMWVLARAVVARDEAGRVQRLVGSASDITERKSYENRLIHQATHDFLTGLRNRAFLIGWLGQRMNGEAQRGDLALLFLDLDGFKLINDSLGHAIGDRLLIAVAERIAGKLRDDEFVVRLGGDEFIVVVTGGSQGSDGAAMACAARVESALLQPYDIEGMELRITVSIGVAIDDGLSDDPDGLLRDADIALYRAKEHGKARTEVFNTALREAILIRHRLQNDLARAIEAGDIFLVYQPIVTLAASRLIGFEALVRWRHPELGLISPARFIPIAEETGQILPLGRFVLETAVTRLERWRAMLPAGRALSVNVNLSARQMWDEAYIEEMLAWLAGRPIAGLKIEVTESMTMSNPEMALTVLNRFRGLAIPLCMDDFGTGYSSLSYLGRFPFDVLKVDKSFVTGLDRDPGQHRLVRGIVNLAHDLGLDVVGEGVETEEERRALREIGCDFAQGYLFARPLAEADAEAMLSTMEPCDTESEIPYD